MPKSEFSIIIVVVVVVVIVVVVVVVVVVLHDLITIVAKFHQPSGSTYCVTNECFAPLAPIYELPFFELTMELVAILKMAKIGHSKRIVLRSSSY